MSEDFSFRITETEAGVRVDLFLAGKMPGISRSRVQRLIEEDHLLVNGRKVKVSYRLKAEDALEFVLPEEKELVPQPENLPLEILYEDDSLAVVNKPSGMVVHPAPGNESGTLVNALLFHMKTLSTKNGVFRAGIVHRIDKDTSGLLMVAKTDAAYLSLSRQLAERTVTREYVALCEGLLKEPRGTIDAPIGRDPSNRLRMAVAAEGKRAVTHYEVQRYYVDTTLLRLRLQTGRTHQIRVHMAILGHPVAGDPVYGYRRQRIRHDGQLLHARMVGFQHPEDGRYMEFSAPVPEGFLKILKTLANEAKGRNV